MQPSSLARAHVVRLSRPPPPSPREQGQKQWTTIATRLPHNRACSPSRTITSLPIDPPPPTRPQHHPPTDTHILDPPHPRHLDPLHPRLPCASPAQVVGAQHPALAKPHKVLNVQHLLQRLRVALHKPLHIQVPAARRELCLTKYHQGHGRLSLAAQHATFPQYRKGRRCTADITPRLESPTRSL